MQLKSADANSSQRASYLDAYRGIACLMVCFYHSATNIGLFQVTFWGFTGVHLFFIISGYLIFKPFLKSLLMFERLPSTTQFYRNRFMRIMPPYLVSLVLYTGLRFVTHTNIPSAKNMFTHILLIFNYFSEKEFFSINPVLWSLAIEAQFYLILPLCVYAVCRLCKPFQVSPDRIVLMLLTLFFITGIVSRGLEFTHFSNHEQLQFPHVQAAHASVLKFRGIFSLVYSCLSRRVDEFE